METNNNQMPDIYYDGNTYNPCIYSPNAPYAIFFEQTNETLETDADLFKQFADNIIKNFRHTKVYTHYKSYLYDLGFNRCQMLGNITSDMAKIEMHHNGLTIFDITIIIIKHLLNTIGKCTSFDVIHHLRYVHTYNCAPLVMLCRTMHQLTHNNDEFYVPVQMTFGNWSVFLNEYKYGMTYGIAKKLDIWIKKSMREQLDKVNSNIIELNEKIKDWSEYNECGYNNNRWNSFNSYNTYSFINNYR